MHGTRVAAGARRVHQSWRTAQETQDDQCPTAAQTRAPHGRTLVGVCPGSVGTRPQSGCERLHASGEGGGGVKGSRYLQSSHRHTVLHAPHRVVVHDPGHYGALGDRHCLGLEARILARAVGRGSDDKRGGEKNASLNKQAPQHGTRRTTPSNGTPIPRITLL
jgi:hypothetical protein